MTEQPTPLLPPHPQPLLLEKPKKKSRVGLVSAIALIVFLVVAGVGIASRAAEERHLKKRTEAEAIPAVAVITAQEGAQVEDVVLPGTIQAWHEAIIYARTAGYLKSWSVDIGAQVKAGDVLAEIDAPDLDAQFHQAQADLNTAIANNNLAQITAKRYVALLKSDSVSRQQVDTQVATAAADQAMVESSKANLDHLQQEEDFKKVIAPFDGTITQRNVDVGSLINGGNSGTAPSSGSATTGQDLFHIAETDRVRVYVQVPETYTGAIKPDLQAELHVPQHPQQVFPAVLSRAADALDPTTRTLLVQLEVDNSDNALLAGGYTDVHIKIPATDQTVMLPVNALLFRDGMHVGVVTNDHVALKPVTIGRDYGKKVEIVDGLSPGETVVVNPPDSLEDGQQVRVIQPKDSGKDQDPSKGQGKSKDKDDAKDQSEHGDASHSSGQPKDQDSNK
jgi:RND family efflux transporter MFP subunit